MIGNGRSANYTVVVIIMFFLVTDIDSDGFVANLANICGGDFVAVIMVMVIIATLGVTDRCSDNYGGCYVVVPMAGAM